MTVFGASGGTGRQIVEQALGRGHEVVAFVRDPATMADLAHERLGVVVGDVLEPASVPPALRGSRAALFALSTRRGRESGRVYSDGIHNVIAGMDTYCVDRLICVSAAGVGEVHASGLSSLARRLSTSRVLRGAYEDMERMEVEVMLSQTTWTIVRPAGLTDGPLTGEYRVVEGRSVPQGRQLSRADLAAFMLKCVDIDVYDRKGVAIAY
jgi:putative NADH-flavin reductase